MMQRLDRKDILPFSRDGMTLAAEIERKHVIGKRRAACQPDAAPGGIDRHDAIAHEPAAPATRRDQRLDVHLIFLRRIPAAEDPGREARIPKIFRRDHNQFQPAPCKLRCPLDRVKMRVSRSDKNHPSPHAAARSREVGLHIAGHALDEAALLRLLQRFEGACEKRRRSQRAPQARIS